MHMTTLITDGAKQPIYLYLGGRASVVQQGTNIWVGSPFSPISECYYSEVRNAKTIH